MVKPRSNDDPRYQVGATVWAKGTVILHEQELHRRFGSLAGKIWIPGIVNRGFVQESKTKRKIRYVDATYYFGGDVMKTKTVAMSQLYSAPPTDMMLAPKDLTTFVSAGGKLTAVPDSDDDTVDPTTVGITSDATTGNRACTVVPRVSIGPESAPNPNITNPSGTVLQPSTTTAAEPSTVTDTLVFSHGTAWVSDPIMCEVDQNGTLPKTEWAIKDPLHHSHRAGGDVSQRLSRLDYFQLMFPPNAMRHIVTLTNVQLGKMEWDDCDIGEIISFFGLILLGTRFEFANRRDLWSNESHSKFIVPPAFGSFSMTRNRFDQLWKCLSFSHQPETRPEEMPHEEYRWKLVDDFIELFNCHREQCFTPGMTVCVDESMVRWYGRGGDWINNGLPMYIAMERKPENGAEVYSSCCGDSGIMMRLKIRKTKACTGRELAQEDGPSINEGTRVLKELVVPWANTKRLVVADSAFSSVQTAEELYRVGLWFIGVIKTATKHFPWKYLNEVQLNGKGSQVALWHEAEETGKPNLLAFVWCDRDRRYFISSCSNMRSAPPILRTRLRQTTPVASNMDPVKVQLEVPLPNAANLYYNSCGRIDQHNRLRQDGLNIEKKFGTHDWAKRFNLSIFSMIVVDSFLVYKGCTGVAECFNEYVHKLADEMIDYHKTTRHQRAITAYNGYETPRKKRSPLGCIVHLTPNKRLRPASTTPSGRENKGQARLQKYCRGKGCKNKSTWLCSACGDDMSLCHSMSGRDCYQAHCEEVHAGDQVVYPSVVASSQP